MSIKENLLQSAGATLENYNASEYIFSERGIPHFYYQVLTGEVKLNNYDEDGKEFIQNILGNDDSFGTSMLCIHKTYPVNAIAISKCVIIKLQKDSFFRLLEEFPSLYNEVFKSLSERLYKKVVLMRKISCRSAAERLKEVMQLMKDEHIDQSPFSFVIPLTRQQLASLTGLCVETTIRTIKKMEREKIVRIENRKILY
ncbi:Crp/Fnr family transcriptional regulator [Chryseobacterium caseinilyticum]|uniref:Crp/Fnr family transcriptional regulator n=1 Tax=Chryseobacterium caseinilyticum TaxID=2771428 RepID=A0ABR8ZC76_9FLAO|nr:Crp/Fnr family transcriptional regulator [Chryseobacterium caseinilyticum]MBD8082846.1 Crp/Fnr family transcriptional regulator [Chryseobacterium caseinilyticum]